MSKNKSFKITVTVIGLIINTIFGLYNLEVTKRIKALTKAQSALILLLSSLSTGIGFIHLYVNKKLGAYDAVGGFNRGN